jgi:hypothetical protein
MFIYNQFAVLSPNEFVLQEEKGAKVNWKLSYLS